MSRGRSLSSIITKLSILNQNIKTELLYSLGNAWQIYRGAVQETSKIWKIGQFEKWSVERSGKRFLPKKGPRVFRFGRNLTPQEENLTVCKNFSLNFNRISDCA